MCLTIRGREWNVTKDEVPDFFREMFPFDSEERVTWIVCGNAVDEARDCVENGCDGGVCKSVYKEGSGFLSRRGVWRRSGGGGGGGGGRRACEG